MRTYHAADLHIIAMILQFLNVFLAADVTINIASVMKTFLENRARAKRFLVKSLKWEKEHI